jgi:hypothetical protein
MYQPPGISLGLFADNTFTYATDHKEGYVLRELQRVLSGTETRYERWNVNINDKTSSTSLIG